MTESQHVEITVNPLVQADNRLVLGGNDLTAGLRGFTLDYSGPRELPTLTLQPLVYTSRIEGGPVKVAASTPSAALGALLAAGWLPPTHVDNANRRIDDLRAELRRVVRVQAREARRVARAVAEVLTHSGAGEPVGAECLASRAEAVRELSRDLDGIADRLESW